MKTIYGIDDKTETEVTLTKTAYAIEINDDTYNKIVKDINNNKKVFVNTGTKAITIKGDNDAFGYFKTGSKKELIATSLRNNFLNIVDNHTTIDMILYMDALLELADRGFVVTENNREEKYLEILETGDEELIDLLETYLIIKDEISIIKSNKKSYNTIISKIKDLDENSEELQLIFDEIV
jgi:DNA-binding PadR family transcriptional regulator